MGKGGTVAYFCITCLGVSVDTGHEGRGELFGCTTAEEEEEEEQAACNAFPQFGRLYI